MYLSKMIGIKAWSDEYIDSRIKKHFDQYFTAYLKQMEWNEMIEAEVKNTVVKLHGNLSIQTSTASVVGKYLYMKEFEQLEMNFIRTFLREGDVFIDIGANIGVFSIIGGESVGQNGKVIAFEPVPETHNLLKSNIAFNNLSNVETHLKAISDKAGTLPFYSYQDGYDAFSSFAKVQDEAPFETILVEVITLGSFISGLPEAERQRIRLIKIDVEGWEIPVLNSAKDYLLQPDAPALLVEFTDANARKAGFSCKALFKVGEDLGYTWYRLGHQGGYTKAKATDPFEYENLIASKALIG